MEDVCLETCINPSPKSVPKAPLDLLIPASYNLLPKGNGCNAFNGNSNKNCATLINTHPRLNTIPKATPFKTCARVLRGLSDIGSVCRVAKSERGGGMGDGLSTKMVIAFALTLIVE